MRDDERHLEGRLDLLEEAELRAPEALQDRALLDADEEQEEKEGQEEYAEDKNEDDENKDEEDDQGRQRDSHRTARY